ncbi:MAG: hypothetical protein ABIP29_09380 [Candidatus Eisenbacteria bacterium]
MKLDSIAGPTSLVLSLAVLALAGCGRDTVPGNALLGPDAGTTLATAAHTAPTFNPADFVAVVDNPFFPLVPGTVFNFAAETPEGSETITIEVLHERKLILGVDCTVVRDRVYLEGTLIEDTFDWYAQDRAGNVWYLGENVKNYENGVFVDSEGSWEAGVNGATAGINMQAHPRVGQTYAQENAPGIAEDMATVVSLKETVTVPYGRFENCLQTMEFSKIIPGARGYKFYARGIGIVLEDSPRGGHERTELISVTRP